MNFELCAFVGSVAACAALARMRSIERHSKLAIGESKSVLLLLHVPQEGNNPLATIINNDEIITKVIHDNVHRIRVIVRGATSSTPGDVLGYISDVYAKLWDEMIAVNKPHIQCTVCAETTNTSLLQEIDFTTLQDIDIFYTTCSTQVDINRIISARAAAKLPPLKVNILPKDTLSHVLFLDKTCNLPLYDKIAMGGTFDHIHNGHFKLLTLAAHLTRQTLIVGLVPDKMLTKKALASRVQPYHTRQQNVYTFLMQLRTTLQVDIVQLEDAYGPTITDPSIQAIIVSSETIANAVKINQIRQSKNFKLLDILVTRRSNVATLSSTFVRKLQEE